MSLSSNKLKSVWTSKAFSTSGNKPAINGPHRITNAACLAASCISRSGKMVVMDRAPVAGPSITPPPDWPVITPNPR